LHNGISQLDGQVKGNKLAKCKSAWVHNVCRKTPWEIHG